jgi:hypothetical protein
MDAIQLSWWEVNEIANATRVYPTDHKNSPFLFYFFFKPHSNLNNFPLTATANNPWEAICSKLIHTKNRKHNDIKRLHCNYRREYFTFLLWKWEAVEPQSIFKRVIYSHMRQRLGHKNSWQRDKLVIRLHTPPQSRLAARHDTNVHKSKQWRTKKGIYHA